MQTVKEGDTVKIHYKATSGKEVVFDSSIQSEPMLVKLGSGEIFPAFEKALIGMKNGDKKTIELVAEEAFGPYMDDLVTTIERSQLPKDLALDVGQVLQVKQPDDTTLLVTVKGLTPEKVTLDANHPLAGKNLTFDIHLVEVVNP